MRPLSKRGIDVSRTKTGVERVCEQNGPSHRGSVDSTVYELDKKQQQQQQPCGHHYKNKSNNSDRVTTRGLNKIPGIIISKNSLSLLCK